MSYNFVNSDESVMVIQRPKNQITIPSVIAKKIGAKKGTKYRAVINKKGNIELVIVKNDIHKYAGIIKNDKTAVEIIRESRMEEELMAMKSINLTKNKAD